MYCVCHSQWLHDIRGAILINECFCFCCLCQIADNFSTMLGDYTFVHTYIASVKLISGILAKKTGCSRAAAKLYKFTYIYTLCGRLTFSSNYTHTHMRIGICCTCTCTYIVCVCVCNSALHTGRYAFHFPHVDFAFGLRRCAQSSVKSA